MDRPALPECMIPVLRSPKTLAGVHLNLTVDLYRTFVGAEYSYACHDARRKLDEMGHGGDDPPDDFDDGDDPSEMAIPRINLHFDLTGPAVLAVEAANALLAVLGECAEATGLEINRRDQLAKRAKARVDQRNRERVERRDKRLRDQGIEPGPAGGDDEEDDLRGGTIRTDDSDYGHPIDDDRGLHDDQDQDFGNADSQ